jgi:hypothetical protein
MVRFSPEWSTKWILAMIARAAGIRKKGPRQSYNGSIRAAPAVGAKTLSDVPAAVLA